MRRRILLITLSAAVSTLLLFAVFHKISWRTLPQKIGLGEAYGPSEEQIQSGEGIIPDLRQGSAPHPQPGDAVEGAGGTWSGDGTFREPKVEAPSPYPEGKTKPPGSNYTKTLVMPKMKGEDTDWIEREMGDLLSSGLLSTAIYHMDDKTQKLRPVKNKGNEAMAYITYIIDFYDQLPEVALFMHSHQFAKHNNDLLDRDAALMVRYLSPERVTREGYMNLRCHWEPGCPEWLHPGVAEPVYEKPEEYYLAASWAELFPMQQIPSVLSQPCCAQFAVSKERLLALPKERYVFLRDWILHTDLSDYLSGRIFEYAWQYLFAGTPVHCPSMSACYCDGYGMCFGDAEKFDYYFEIRFNANEYKEELRLWREKAEKLERVRAHAEGGRLSGGEKVDIPEVGRDVWLEGEIGRLEGDMKRLREEAHERGRDPRMRAKEAGREWREGDGY